MVQNTETIITNENTNLQQFPSKPEMCSMQMGISNDSGPFNGITPTPRYVLCETSGQFIVDHSDEDLSRSFSSNYENVYNIQRTISPVEQDARIENVLCEISGKFIPVEVSLSENEIKRKNRRRRLLGKGYLGFKKHEGTVLQNVMKIPRALKARCAHKLSKTITKYSFMCERIAEQDRKVFFENFWKIDSWAAKRAYVQGLVSTRKIRKHRINVANRKKKNIGHNIYFPTVTGLKYRICRKLFLNTLCIGEDTFKRWTQIYVCSVPSNKNSNDTSLVRLTAKRKRRNDIVDNINAWLDLLPVVPSHYCRASSQRKYVENSFLSVRNMMSVYKDWCVKNGHNVADRNMFSKTLKAAKVSIFKPRKDQCDICVGYKLGNINKTSYEEHQLKKIQGRDAKKQAKESANDSTLVLTMDLQSVLLCPKLLASAAYYKQKLQFHNFTIYVLNNRDVTLYTWHEADGGVTSNEFSSCIIDYLKQLPEQYKKVILISDGCNYQNRNKVLASAISDFSKLSGVEVEQLILEKGHTMMEADSVHSTLEHYFKPPIFSPSDYVSRMQLARSNQPYKIKNVHFDFFLNYYQLPTNLNSLRPGKKAGDPLVTDIRRLRYLRSGDIQFKLNYTGPWVDLPQRRRISSLAVPTRLYDQPISITESKYRHLQELKEVIDKDHHPFYDSLTFA